MLMAYDLTRVQKEFNDVCNKAGVQVTCPIKLNGRLKRTLGQVHHITVGDVTTSTLVEFSKQLLATSTDASIESVIKHEAAHYIATARSGKAHGHNAYFKAICAEIGTDNDGTKTQVERTVDNSVVYKYQVECPNCGVIKYAHRMGKTLKNLSYCSCGKCGSSNLKLVQNY